MLTVVLILCGIALLIAGGTSLVHGASQIASRFGVSPMVVGLTIVAFGTSMPELVVNMIGVSRGATELAFGNIVGSNMANLALVLGAAAVMRPIDIQGQLVRRELPLLLFATAVLTVMSMDYYFNGSASEIGRSDAVILLLVFCIFLYIAILDFVRSKRADPLLTDIAASPFVDNEPQKRFSVLFVVAGMALLYFGGDVTVRYSVQLAESLNISAAIVGLYIVALGTSMPELVTSIIAARRNESDLALGNIVGSNLFNTLIVLPSSALLGPVTIPQGGVTDVLLSLLFAASLIPIFVFRKARLGRLAGLSFLSIYVIWMLLRVSG